MKKEKPRQSSWTKRAFPIIIIVLMLSTAATAMGNNAAVPMLRWGKFFGGNGDESGNGIFVSGESIYVSGTTNSWGGGQEDIAVFRCDPAGKINWYNTWGGISQDFGKKIYVSDNNVYVVGTTWSFGYENAAILKFDAYCSLLWSKLWGNPSYGGYDNFNDVFVLGTDVYCVGDSEIGFGNPLLLLQRYDTYGNLKWTKLWGPTGYNVHTGGRGIAISGSDIYVVGYTESAANRYDALVMKYDTLGNLIWNKTFGGTADDEAVGIAILGNDIYVVGATASFGVGGGFDILLLKYDTTGNLKWFRTYGGGTEDRGYDICISMGRIYIVGTTVKSGVGFDAAVLVTDLSGNVVWHGSRGGVADDVARGVHVLGNDIFVVGDTASFGSGGKDIFVARAKMY